jgi:hypothetical protein
LMGKAKQSMEMAEFMQAFGRRGVVEVESWVWSRLDAIGLANNPHSKY